jgi:hypothetical protein
MKHFVNYEHLNTKMYVQYDYYIMAHVQKPVFVLWINEQALVIQQQYTVQSAVGSQGVRIGL